MIGVWLVVDPDRERELRRRRLGARDRRHRGRLRAARGGLDAPPRARRGPRHDLGRAARDVPPRPARRQGGGRALPGAAAALGAARRTAPSSSSSRRRRRSSLVFSLPFAFVAADDGRDDVARVGGRGARARLDRGRDDGRHRSSPSGRATPRNKGKTARNGLWGWSRHPNYFFEWLHWVAWAVIALSSPYGWVAIVVPVLPARAALQGDRDPARPRRSRSAAAATTTGATRRRCSVFVPLPPKRSRAA